MNKNICFIAGSEKYSTIEEPVPAPYLRKSFYLDENPCKGKITVCTAGFYEIYINGNKITRSRLAPYISNPDDCLYEDEYELTEYLAGGENVIGFLLGNGLRNNPGGWVWDFDKAVFRGVPAVSASLSIVTSTKNITIEADSSFKTHPSPVRFDDYRLGEYYDAGKEIPNWCCAGFDDSGWKNAYVTESPKGAIYKNCVEPIVNVREIKPASITKVPGGYIYDFGINSSGVCRLLIDGTPGQTIIMNHGEHLLEDGSLDIKHMSYDESGLVQKDIYICKGTKNEEYTPTFTYHGFRYVYIRGLLPSQAVQDTLTYIVQNTALSERGGFSCSDERINRLQEITRSSTLSNFHHFPTDCPQREKNGWTADIALSAEHTLLNLSPEACYRQWLRSLRKAMRHDGALPGIVPTGGWGFEWGNGPAWDCVIACLPYYIYIYRNDREVLEENAVSIFRYLEYLNSRKNEIGLIEIGLGDWCPPGRAHHDYKAPLMLTDSIISMDICDKSAYIFRTLGMEAEEKYAFSFKSDLKMSIRKNLVDLETMTAAGSCQTSQAMALFYGIFDKSEIPEAVRVLLNLIGQSGGLMDTGVLGARVIFHVLAEYGHSDLAAEMITTGRFPSYGYWLDQGATTLWEDFTLPGGQVNSLNHHFWGDISHWFIRWLAGIHYNPDKKGGSLDIRPQFIKNLDFAEGFHISPEGRISSGWERKKDGSILLTLEIPQKLSGKIILPEGYVFETGIGVADINSGKYNISPK